MENLVSFDFGEFWFSDSRFGFGLNQFESLRITRSQSKMTNWGHLVVWKWLKMVKCALLMVKNGFSWSKMGFRRRWFQWAKFHQLTNPENQNSNFKKPRWATDTSIKKYSKVLKPTLVHFWKTPSESNEFFQVISVAYDPYDIGSQKAASIVKIWSMDSGGVFENLTKLCPLKTLKWP